MSIQLFGNIRLSSTRRSNYRSSLRPGNKRLGLRFLSSQKEAGTSLLDEISLIGGGKKPVPAQILTKETSFYDPSDPYVKLFALQYNQEATELAAEVKNGLKVPFLENDLPQELSAEEEEQLARLLDAVDDSEIPNALKEALVKIQNSFEHLAHEEAALELEKSRLLATAKKAGNYEEIKKALDDIPEAEQNLEAMVEGESEESLIEGLSVAINEAKALQRDFEQGKIAFKLEDLPPRKTEDPVLKLEEDDENIPFEEEEDEEVDSPSIYVPAEDVEDWKEAAKDTEMLPPKMTITQSASDSVFGPSGKYARQLFQSALEEKAIAQVEKEAAIVQDVLSDPEIIEELRNPTTPKESKLEIIADVMDQIKGSDVLRNFLEYLIDNKRGSIIISMLGDFSKLAKIHRNEFDGVIYTAEPLTPEVLSAAEKMIKERYLTAKDRLLLKNEVDPTILGGCKLRVGNAFGDFSYKTMLDERLESLLEETRSYYGDMTAKLDALLP